jgi:hypothetical protein
VDSHQTACILSWAKSGICSHPVSIGTRMPAQTFSITQKGKTQKQWGFLPTVMTLWVIWGHRFITALSASHSETAQENQGNSKGSGEWWSYADSSFNYNRLYPRPKETMGRGQRENLCSNLILALRPEFKRLLQIVLTYRMDLGKEIVLSTHLRIHTQSPSYSESMLFSDK